MVNNTTALSSSKKKLRKPSPTREQIAQNKKSHSNKGHIGTLKNDQAIDNVKNILASLPQDITDIEILSILNQSEAGRFAIENLRLINPKDIFRLRLNLDLSPP